MADDAQPRPDIPGRADVIRRVHERGGKVAAVFPIHYPRALLRAFDIQPVEVWGPPGRDTAAGDAHLQPYTCSIVRAGLAFVLEGGAADVDLIVVPHACDSLQGIGSVLLDFLPPSQPVVPLYMPRGRAGGAELYLTEELAALYERLAELTGQRPTDAELGEALEREQAADRRIAELFGARRSLPLSERAFYEVVRAREYLPAEQFSEVAQAALGSAVDAPCLRVPLVLSGLVPEPMDVLDAIDRAGGMVVADDVACVGRRQYAPGHNPDPLRRMAESLLGGPPDPTLGASVQDRLEHLEGLIDDTDAKAVVFYSVKFCEPEQFQLPLVRKALDRRGIRSVLLEVDISDALPHQLHTQLEALLETVS